METPVSMDSAMQKLSYTTEGIIVLRVPDNQLDTLLELLEPLCAFMGYREITGEDVRLKLSGNRLERYRALKSQRRLTTDIDQKGRKLSDLQRAENTREQKEKTADEAQLAGMALRDAVHFSTVSISLYQDPGARYSLVAREKNIIPFRASFTRRLAGSVAGGWELFQDLMIQLAGLWPVCLILAAVYSVFRWYLRTGRMSKSVQTKPV